MAERGDHPSHFDEGNELWNLISIPWFALIMVLSKLCKIIIIKYLKEHPVTYVYILRYPVKGSFQIRDVGRHLMLWTK